MRQWNNSTSAHIRTQNPPTLHNRYSSFQTDRNLALEDNEASWKMKLTMYGTGASEKSSMSSGKI
jgi:hypothetical protein